MLEHDWETIISALSKHIANLISFVFSASNLAVFEHPILGYMKLRRQGYYWGMGGQMGQHSTGRSLHWMMGVMIWSVMFAKGEERQNISRGFDCSLGGYPEAFRAKQGLWSKTRQGPWSLRSTGAFPLKLLQAPLLGAGLKLDSKGNHRTDSAIVWPLKTTQLFMMNSAAPSLFILCWQPTYLSTKHRTLIVAS